MNKKVIFRILGALSSGLIIASVFVPFVSVTGFSTSLWQSYEKALYLPIIIIVFGLIGVIFFALNKKTEFAYMSTGATLFFAAITGIDAINDGTFNTFSIGFYFLVAGSILTGLMAFFHNLGSKKNDTIVTNNVEPQQTLSQVDDLYSNNIPVNNQQVNNMFGPMHSNNEQVNNIQPIQLDNQQVNNVIEPVQPNNQLQNNIPQQPISEHVQSMNQPNDYLKPIPDFQPQQQVVEQQGENPVLAENIANEVIQELKEGPHIDYAANDIFSPKVNPVVQEFSNQSTPAPTNQNVNTGATDIFGQPINK